MARNIIAALLIGVLGGWTGFAPIPGATAHGRYPDSAFSPSTVRGEVTQKFNTGVIVVEGQPWRVPPDFFNQVQVGMMVQFNGTDWSIVGGGTQPPAR